MGFQELAFWSRERPKAPPLKELRAMLDAKFGQQAWDEHEEWGKAAPMKPTLSLVDALNKRAG